MAKVPKPRREGGTTAGPLVSVQTTTSLSFAPDHSARRRPVLTERAPYLTALVVNSCTATAGACAGRGFTMTSRAIFEAPIISPSLFLTGEMVSEIGTGLPRSGEAALRCRWTASSMPLVIKSAPTATTARDIVGIKILFGRGGKIAFLGTIKGHGW
jgi:hypothetical protein